jgi:hypothetical protein
VEIQLQRQKVSHRKILEITNTIKMERNVLKPNKDFLFGSITSAQLKVVLQQYMRILLKMEVFHTIFLEVILILPLKNHPLIVSSVVRPQWRQWLSHRARSPEVPQSRMGGAARRRGDETTARQVKTDEL